ncbi:MarR family winged helix-turn-helix transcriptional regulator [Nocardiopsis sp. NPDC058631]|uniref:MarR family winged helix-turn-helix transcriptional regulator n=1 Tax=Nocardiopsis sp. NPDC058631 TaxID=3346566 RepID=UPI003662078E
MCTTPAGRSDERAPSPLPSTAERLGPVGHGIVRVARLHRMLAGQLLRRLGLHPAQELVMMQLWELGPQRLSDLARLLGTDAATMTRTVQRLEQGGFAKRTPSPTDKRVTIVEATTASQGLRAEVERVWEELEQGLTHDLHGAERDGVLAVLDRMEQNLEETIDRVRSPQV